jgi:hypothetical protein
VNGRSMFATFHGILKLPTVYLQASNTLQSTSNLARARSSSSLGARNWITPPTPSCGPNPEQISHAGACPYTQVRNCDHFPHSIAVVARLYQRHSGLVSERVRPVVAANTAGFCPQVYSFAASTCTSSAASSVDNRTTCFLSRLAQPFPHRFLPSALANL